MQSYLGDYPGSRKNPEIKFVRAVTSFLSQKHNDKELVIVSDGCEKTKQIYEMLYYHDSRIKFKYVEKSDKGRMYEVKDGKNFYRGIPRKIGCDLTDCDVIAYMDSDDIMLNNRLSDLADAWSTKSMDIKWASNPWRYIHGNAVKNKLFAESKRPAQPTKIIRLKDYGYDVSDDNLFFLNETATPKYINLATYSLSHRKDIEVSWQDSEDTDGKSAPLSEDVLFANNLHKLYGGVSRFFRQESAAYVVCHYRGVWDI